MAEHPRLIFDEIARQIGQAHQEDRQFVDTYAMVDRAARADLIDRLRGASERLLKAVKAEAADAYTHLEASLNLEQLYGPAKEKPTGLLNKAEYAVRLNEVGQQVVRLREGVSALFEGDTPRFTQEQQSEVAKWLGYLEKIMADEVTVSSDKVVSELKPKKKGGYRLVSLTDPEATMRIHGSQSALGYNVSVLTDTHFVREIQVDTDSTPDNQGLERLLASQKEHHDFVPKEVAGDRAYGTGKVRHQVAQATDGQTQMMAYLPDFESRSDKARPTLRWIGG